MQQLIINDHRTYHCIGAMRANGGRWVPEIGWVFSSADDAANALATLYRVTLATLDQREQIERMIADGTAEATWESIEHWTPEFFERLTRVDAARMISAGNAMRCILGVHPLEDLPEPVGDGRFDTSDFERAAEARRERVRRAA